ncbi:MAG: hypothetical protein LBV07_06825 [Syntrophobacterales bacterium]|jgi:hypothetical protein|nr:hypothetical protein [Syntrophobacterales bacterium]
MIINEPLLDQFYHNLDERSQNALDHTIDEMVRVKEQGGKIVVVTGSGPNLHEGVTTLIAELIRLEMVDGVTTSSAVIAHELAGTLDRVRMCDAAPLGFDKQKMPRGNLFEFTVMTPDLLEQLREEMILDENLLEKGRTAEGHFVIKAAGNMAYPMGLRTEMIAQDILHAARQFGLTFEEAAGAGCDERTMLGASSKRGIPILVTLPQIVGGGHVGLAIGDSIPISRRSSLIAQMMSSADMIIESAVALTQEIHDGPFETYTGHGIWSWWQGFPTYRLEEKTLVRIDLDENLRKAQDLQRDSAMIQEAITRGLPKTKISKIPFRMEMSAFSRLEKSIPIIGDIGEVWPLIACRTAKKLGHALSFMSYKQETDEGKKMREWIVDQIKPFDKKKMLSRLDTFTPRIK